MTRDSAPQPPDDPVAQVDLADEPEGAALPDGWAAGERAYPYFDPKIESTVYAHHRDPEGGEYAVSVSPQLFNDRVLLTHSSTYPRTWDAGFCYDKGPAAVLAAQVWNPVTEPRPAGYKRVAGDNRYPHLPDEGEHPNERVGPTTTEESSPR